MRKILFATTITLLIANFVSAQKTRVGFTAGPVMSNLWQKVGGETDMQDYRVGLTCGILLDVPMLKNGSFQPGFNFVTKGSKNSYTDASGQVDTKTHLEYIELPLNVVFRIPKGGGNFIVGAGVAPALAISGENILVNGNSRGSKDISFGDAATDDLIGTDFGLNGLVGYEFKNGFFVTANYNHGINRLSVGGDPKDKLYNRYFALRLGWLIGKK